jgi:hypothetical protein
LLFCLIFIKFGLAQNKKRDIKCLALLKNLSFYFLEDYLASAAFTSTEAFAAVVSATAVTAVSAATAAVSATTASAGVSAAASVAFPPQDANTTAVIAKNNAFFIVFFFVFFLLYTYICFY